MTWILFGVAVYFFFAGLSLLASVFLSLLALPIALFQSIGVKSNKQIVRERIQQLDEDERRMNERYRKQYE